MEQIFDSITLLNQSLGNFTVKCKKWMLREYKYGVMIKYLKRILTSQFFALLSLINNKK